MPERLIQLGSKNSKKITNFVEPPDIVPSTFWIYKQKLKITFFTIIYFWRSKHSLSSARRFFMAFVAPQSYRDRIRARLEGGCNNCGHCCKVNFKCPFLKEMPDGKGKCTIYLTKHAPKACVAFPLEPWDLEEIQRAIAPNKCSFSFAPERVEKPFRERLPIKIRKLLKLDANI
jgi:Fe-S-cluster containining protein